jgi:hypothetical protein
VRNIPRGQSVTCILPFVHQCRHHLTREVVTLRSDIASKR